MTRAAHQPDPSDSRTPFQKFDALARRVFSAPKAEVDKRAAKDAKMKHKPKR